MQQDRRIQSATIRHPQPTRRRDRRQLSAQLLGGKSHVHLATARLLIAGGSPTMIRDCPDSAGTCPMITGARPTYLSDPIFYDHDSTLWQLALPYQRSISHPNNVRLSEPQPDGDDCYWLESRPQEQGRSALVHLAADGTRRDLLPAPLSVRTRLNEYGGGSYCVMQGQVYLVLDSDQRIYQLAADGELKPISPEGPYRYADLTIDAPRRRLICVREDHSAEGTEEQHDIVALALDGSESVQVLVSGADRYSKPRISPDSTLLSWLCGHQRTMPWDGSECYVATLDANGQPQGAQCIAGGANESVFQPQCSP